MLLPDFDPSSIPPEAIPAVMSTLAAWIVQLAARQQATTPMPETLALLDIEQAAKKLSVKPDWLYRRGKKLGLAVKLGDGTLRFSTHAIEAYIRQQSTTPAPGRRRKPRVDNGDSFIS